MMQFDILSILNIKTNLAIVFSRVKNYRQKRADKMHQIEIKTRPRLNYQHTYRITHRHQAVMQQQHHNGKSSSIIVQKATVKSAPVIG